ncbi:MAG: DUF1822 family protein [Symploca sp. SIO1A3]|nr:DUF1822 family protein [Symploca sp. SIO1A3]
MHINFKQFTSPPEQQFEQKSPLPGEIWEISCFVQSPLEFSTEEQQRLYSDIARSFLEGNTPPRYAMIITEPESPEPGEEDWRVISVMLFSEQTNFLSDVDILLPTGVSGMEQDLLALTWQVQPMLAVNLAQSVGQRLSREIYDALLNIGDYYHGLVEQPPTRQSIESLGLRMGTVKNSPSSAPFFFAEFHQQEEAWADVLKVPLDAYRTYQRTMKFTGEILDAALELEQELNRVSLRQWLQDIFEEGWLSFAEFLPQQTAFAIRSQEDSSQLPSPPQEITKLIEQLSPGKDEYQRRLAAKQLGEIGSGNQNAITALVNLLRTTTDDETLWTAVESLWQIDPHNPAAGTRRVKLIDWGMQVGGNAIALSVALIQKVNGQVGILLRIYPTGDAAYLPPELKLLLLDESGQILREVTARQADIYIQLKLNGQPGEQFSVSVALGEGSITEDFVI